MDIRDEVYAFLTMVYCGVIMGILFDIYRRKKHHFRRIRIIDSIEDVLFWIVQAGVLFLFVYWSSNGEIRMFSIIGAASGAILYHYTLSRPMTRVLDAIFKATIGISQKISRTCKKIKHIINMGTKKVAELKIFHRR
jgi:spore cortex biosynthesis protein YabQ